MGEAGVGDRQLNNSPWRNPKLWPTLRRRAKRRGKYINQELKVSNSHRQFCTCMMIIAVKDWRALKLVGKFTCISCFGYHLKTQNFSLADKQAASELANVLRTGSINGRRLWRAPVDGTRGQLPYNRRDSFQGVKRSSIRQCIRLPRTQKQKLLEPTHAWCWPTRQCYMYSSSAGIE